MNNLWRLDGVELWQLAGWTMLHFLWIGAAVAVVAGVSRLVLRGTSPAVRYAVALGCLVALAAAPAGIASWLALQAPTAPVAYQTAIPNMPAQMQANAAQQVAGPDLSVPTYSVPLAPGASEQPVDERPLGATGYAGAISENPGITGGATGTAILVGNIFERAVPYLPWLWIVGAPVTFILLATGVVGADRLRRASRPIVDGPIVDACRRLRESLRITREVAVAVCERIAAPVLVGIVRPVILLPPSALTGWSPDEIEMVLLHELAHVRRWDNLVNLAQRLVESLLFFHPAVWWISGWVRHEREECCDRVVVGRTNRPHAYAEMLVALAAQMPRSVLFHPTASSAMAAGPLRNRIRRILQLEDDPMLISGKSLAVVTATLVVVVTLTVLYLPARGNAEQSADGLDEKSITIEVTNKVDGEQETDVFDDPNELRAVFKVGRDNTVISKTYEVPLKLRKSLPQQFESLKSDPFGPQVNLDEIWSSDGARLTLVAPKAAQNAIAKEFKLIVVADHGPSTYATDNWPEGAVFQSPGDGEIAHTAWKKLGLKLVPATSMELEEADVSGGLKIVGGNSIPREALNPRPGFTGPPILVKIQSFTVEDFGDLQRALRFLESQSRKQIVVSCVQAVMEDGRETTAFTDFVVPYPAEDQRLELKSGDQVTVAELKSRALKLSVAPDGRFPTLEEQKLADRAWRQLGLELEPIKEDDLRRVNELGFGGGLKVSSFQSRAIGLGEQSIGEGDILVGLHVWPTTSLAAVGEVLDRGDLTELDPLKYYIVREGSGFGGRGDRVVSGRIGVAGLPAGKGQATQPPAVGEKFDILLPATQGLPPGTHSGVPGTIRLPRSGNQADQPKTPITGTWTPAASAAPLEVSQALDAKSGENTIRLLTEKLQEFQRKQEALKRMAASKPEPEVIDSMNRELVHLDTRGAGLVLQAKVVAKEAGKYSELAGQIKAMEKAIDDYVASSGLDAQERESIEQLAGALAEQQVQIQKLRVADQQQRAADQEQREADRQWREAQRQQREAEAKMFADLEIKKKIVLGEGPVPVQVPAPVAVPLARAPVAVSVPVAPTAPAAPDAMLKAPISITAAADGTLQLAASNLPYVVHFEQGASRFKPDDNIKILEVRGTSEKFMPGHLFWIKGTYKLGSQDQAQLAVYTTAKNAADANSHTWKTQWINIDRGNGTFELYLPMSHWGWPHVSFYPVHGGSSFGGTYFGTDDMVLKKWWDEGGVIDRTSATSADESSGRGSEDDLFGPAPAQEGSKATWSADEDLFGPAEAPTSSAEPSSSDAPSAEVAVGPTPEGEVTGTILFHSNKPNLRYEGKTFQEWQNVLTNELSPKQRLEAIRAIAAFGASGYGEEAAGVILGVALQYDWSDLSDSELLPIQEACVKALGGSWIGPSGKGDVAQRVPREAVLPMLIDVAEAATHSEDKNMKLFLTNMFPFYVFDPRGFDALLELTRDKDQEVRVTALNRFLMLDIQEDDQHQEMRDKQLERIRQELADGDKRASERVLLKLIRYSYDSGGNLSQRDSRLIYVPELFPKLFSRHESVRRAARQALQYIQSQDAAPVVAQLQEVLADDSRQADHMEAIRALAAMGKQAEPAIEELKVKLASGKPVERAAAAAALQGMLSNVDYKRLLVEKLGDEYEIRMQGGVLIFPDNPKQLEFNEFQKALDQETENLFLESADQGGGFGGGGGGMF